jgi:hypothetical protein
LAKPKSKPTRVAEATKQQRISQTTFPAYSLEKALLIPRAIVDHFGGRSGNPAQVAIAIDWTPTGGAWRALSGAAIAYGLTDGGYGASEIRLTARGSAIVAPTEENGERAHLRDAIMEPTLMRAFIERYDNAKFPSRDIAVNVLASMGLPRDRCGDAYDLIEQNLAFVGALVPTKTGRMVLLSVIGSQLTSSGDGEGSAEVAQKIPDGNGESATPGREANGVADGRPAAPSTPSPLGQPKNLNVFISHGKNRDLIDTLKRAVAYGKFHPVVSVELSDTSKPVPQKVMEEMRSCFGGIIHLRSEGEWTDGDGKKHTKINDNVLIEIGAAMAMYKDNFILLAERSVQLPSNLQGLFVCYYDGDRLDGEATMRLLEGLSKFQP